MRLILILVVISCLTMTLLTGCENKPKLIKSGKVEKIEYLKGSFGSPSRTIFYFEDGSTYIMYDLVNMPPSKDISIYEGEYYDYIKENLK